MYHAQPSRSKHNTRPSADAAPLPDDWPRVATPEETTLSICNMLRNLGYDDAFPASYDGLCDLAREWLRERPSRVRQRGGS